MSASMWRIQHPSAPNAVAIVSRGWNFRTAQLRIACGDAPASSWFAAASSSSDNFCMAQRPPGEQAVEKTWRNVHFPIASQTDFLYHHNKDFVKRVPLARKNGMREGSPRASSPDVTAARPLVVAGRVT